jgi:hypothetical protein
VEALGPLSQELAVKRLEYKSFSEQDEVYETRHHFWKF